MATIADFFHWLAAKRGYNFSIFYDRFDGTQFLYGIWTTIHLSFFCVLLSVLFGAIGVWLQRSSFEPLRWLVGAYVGFFRNTPPLVQLYFFYFAVDPVLSSALGVKGGLLSNYGWALLVLSLYAGAFNTEIFRSGIEAVPKSTCEAAEALGYTPLQIFRHVTFPLAFRVSFPAMTSNLVNLIKTTTTAYAISVAETLYVANRIWSDQFNVFEMMNVVWVVYLVLVGLFLAFMTRWEKALRVPGFGRSK
ncbi:amino acid ABC transporter permease [Paracoccus sp. MKU1]|uniref:amino acid ABC transporter permease n=1 Tax=Paracoccus sp. MKU1 TaxID=1745182 RepID=UPI00071910EE|nr:amino acid ABC transporter permease [Paracoccus sp. MKU1]KRW96659.1 polar amino acid ABC transporter permease [Paracoccus sp. MKU1]